MHPFYNKKNAQIIPMFIAIYSYSLMVRKLPILQVSISMIPKLILIFLLRFTLHLLLHFSITTECYVIIHVLKFLFFVNYKSQPILSDFQSYLLSILKSFNNHISPLVLEIKPITYQLKIALKTVNFLWTPSYLCILGNEPTHNLATFPPGFSSCIVDLQFLFMTSNTF